MSDIENCTLQYRALIEQKTQDKWKARNLKNIEYGDKQSGEIVAWKGRRQKAYYNNIGI